MKPTLLPPFHQIFDHYKPSTICEIGTHDGKSAIQFIDYCIQYDPRLSYTGYDVFDAVKNNKQFHKKEINGKGAGKYSTAKNNIEHRRTKSKKFKYKLIRGFTQDTLTEGAYDFVYIDGGHSYETVKHDYEKLKGSSVIVFDDYQVDDVKRFFDELVSSEHIPQVPWDEIFKTVRPCWSFMPHKGSAHIQPVIFNT